MIFIFSSFHFVDMRSNIHHKTIIHQIITYKGNIQNMMIMINQPSCHSNQLAILYIQMPHDITSIIFIIPIILESIFISLDYFKGSIYVFPCQISPRFFSDFLYTLLQYLCPIRSNG